MGESTSRKVGNQTSSPMVSELKQQTELQVEDMRQKIYHDMRFSPSISETDDLMWFHDQNLFLSWNHNTHSKFAIIVALMHPLQFALEAIELVTYPLNGESLLEYYVACCKVIPIMLTLILSPQFSLLF